MPSRSGIVGQPRRASLAEALIARLVEVDLKDTVRAAAADVLGPSPTSDPPLTKAAVKEEEAAGRLLNAEALAIVVEARASAADLAIFMLGNEKNVVKS